MFMQKITFATKNIYSKVRSIRKLCETFVCKIKNRGFILKYFSLRSQILLYFSKNYPPSCKKYIFIRCTCAEVVLYLNAYINNY